VKEIGEASPGTDLVDTSCRRPGSRLDRFEVEGAGRKPSHDEGHREASDVEVGNGESNDRDEPTRHA
jgi:hypothetical protein